MTDLLEFKLTLHEYLELAEKAIKNKNGEKAVIYLKQALNLDKRSVVASVMLAESYDMFGANEFSKSVLFKALSLHPNSKDKQLIFYQLARNFFWLGDEAAESFYMMNLDGEEDDEEVFFENDSDFSDDGSFYLASKPSKEEYSQLLVEEAYELVKENKFEEAITLLEGVDLSSKYLEEANHVLLVCYMMKNDIDKAIYSALEMLKHNEKSLSVNCTLATAYFVEEKIDEAKKVLHKLLQTEYTNILDIMLFLPILINLDMHNEIKKYSSRVLETMSLQPDCMLWLSQASYNCGQKTVAIKVMKKIYSIFPDHTVAKFFLNLYKSSPESVGYSLGLPQQEVVERYNKLDGFLKLNDLNFKKQYKKDEDMRDLIAWAISERAQMVVFALIDKLSTLKIEDIGNFFREQLITKKVQIGVMSKLMFALLDNGISLDCDVVVQNRFKTIHITLPQGYYQLPNILRDAIWHALSNLVYFEDEPNELCADLLCAVAQIVEMGDDGKMVYKNANAQQIARMRNENAMMGVLLQLVYDEEDIDKLEYICDRYKLKDKTVQRYKKILFGDKNGQ